MQKVKDMSWNNTASVRRTALCFVLAFFAFPPFLAAQEPTSVTKAELVKRLENRVEKFRSFAVSYKGDQIFPEGCFNWEVAMVHGDDEALGGSGGGEIPEGNWPSETTIRDIDVEWILRLDDELSVIEVGRSVFNDWSLQFAPLRRRSFFSGKGDPAIVSFEPRSGNPGGDPIAIPENAPEYFEGWPPNMDANHASVIGRGLFQSIGLAWHSGGNPLMQKTISADSISNLQPISETRHSFVVTDGDGLLAKEFICDLTSDGEARFVSCVVNSSGRPLFEMSYDYTDDGIAKTINAATYMGDTLYSQVELALIPDSIRRDVPREAAVFPGVPVGGVIRNHDMEHFYVAADGSRVQFDPRVPRSAPPANRGLYLVIGLGAAILVVAFTTYRKLAR